MQSVYNRPVSGSGEKRRAPTAFFCYYRQLIYEGMNERQSIRRFYDRRSWYVRVTGLSTDEPVPRLYKRLLPLFFARSSNDEHADVLLSADAAAAAIV